MFETSEYNVTYLLGAGASAKALPTVKKTETTNGMSTEFERVAAQLKDLKFDDKYAAYILDLKKNLIWLSKKTLQYGTPDTFAKFLYLKSPNELSKLKNALSAFFLIEQLLNKKFDQRSLIFLVNIMERNMSFPGNIKILTWNYDFQIELAARVFKEESLTRVSSISKHSPPLMSYYPPLGFPINSSKDVSIVHLNGIAGVYLNDESRIFKSVFGSTEKEDANYLLKLLSEDYQNIGSSLNFAWEDTTSETSTTSVNFAKEIAANTDVLVIIGYSFPFFNRRIDKDIFDSFRRSGRLKTIYYQDPYRSGEFLSNQFQLSKEVQILDIKEVDNYFVPLEL